MCKLTRKAFSDCTNTINHRRLVANNRRLVAYTVANIDFSVVPECVVEYIAAYLNIRRIQGRDISRTIRELLGERNDAEEE